MRSFASWEVVGEAAGHLSDAFRPTHPDMPWQRLKDLRHVLIHGYANVDILRVWDIATTQVNPLRTAVERALTDRDDTLDW